MKKRSIDYWKDREKDIIEKGLNDYEKAIEKLYERLLKKAMIEYKDLIKNPDDYKLQLIQDEIDSYIDVISKKEEKYLTAHLYAVYKGAQKASEMFFREEGYKSVKLVPKKVIERVLATPWASDGLTFSTRIWKNQAAQKMAMRNILVHGYAKGYSVREMSNMLKQATGVELYQAKRLVRTETIHFYNQAHINNYKDHGVEFVEWINTEEGCCDDCADMAGVYTIDEAPIPPDDSHPNCRCTLAPVVDYEPPSKN